MRSAAATASNEPADGESHTRRVVDLDEALRAAVAAGGRVLTERTTIAGVGPPRSTFSHLFVHVSDLDPLIEFYEDALGLPVDRSPEGHVTIGDTAGFPVRDPLPC